MLVVCGWEVLIAFVMWRQKSNPGTSERDMAFDELNEKEGILVIIRVGRM